MHEHGERRHTEKSPAHDRAQPAPLTDQLLVRAAHAGRWDVVGEQGLVRLQRMIGNDNTTRLVQRAEDHPPTTGMRPMSPRDRLTWIKTAMPTPVPASTAERLRAAEAELAAGGPGPAMNALEQQVVGLYGNRFRRQAVDPDLTGEDKGGIYDGKDSRRVDDVPIDETFRRSFNRLQSWKIVLSEGSSDLFNGIVGERFDQLPKDLKLLGTEYKRKIRTLTNVDTEPANKAYLADVGLLRSEVDDLNTKIATRFPATPAGKAYEGLAPEEITDRIHARGTDIWRELWKDAVIKVNLALNTLWPSTRSELETWRDGLDPKYLGTEKSDEAIGDLEYIGSTAKGYKGPPKQSVRFNPADFDVDANLHAPPVAAYLLDRSPGADPDRGRLFVRSSPNVVPALTRFVDSAHEKLKAIGAAEDGDKFDVAVHTTKLGKEDRTRVLTERLIKLRGELPATRYRGLLERLKREGLVTDDMSAFRLELADDKREPDRQRALEIMDDIGVGEK